MVFIMTTALSSWRGMRNRCLNPNQASYKHYGGRSIEICSEWLNFEAFLSDMGEPPTPEHSIERIDNDGNYHPSNCRWATHLEQANNARSNVRITIDGVTKNMTEWCAASGVNVVTAHTRIKRGWDPSLAVTKKASKDNNSKYKFFYYEGKGRTLREISKMADINYHTLRQRINRSKMTLEQALNKPIAIKK